jgi:segregation and condensation protein B
MIHIDRAERNIEAILFASGEPVALARLCEALALDEKTAKNLIERIRERYLAQGSPLEINILGESFQMCALPEYSEVIRKALTLKKGAALSQAALEALALVAYNQPVTRAFVEQVRGVDCSNILRGLLEKNLIEEAGRLPIPGKPISYQTTAVFLRSFGLESLEQLPELPEEPELEGETPKPQGDADELDGQIDFFE